MTPEDLLAQGIESPRVAASAVIVLEQIEAAKLLLMQGGNVLPYNDANVLAIAQLIGATYIARSLPG